MKKYISFLLFAICLCISNSILGQFSIDSLTIDRKKFKVTVLNGDSIFTYVPEAWILDTTSYENIISNIEPSKNTKSVAIPNESMNLSHIPTTYSIDKTKDVGQIEIQESTTNGALNYTIPIELYTGSNMLSPLVKLSYNSLSNGTDDAGYGWKIIGLSAIKPVNNSIYYEGKTDGIDANKSKSNAWTLDGRKLINLKTGTAFVENYQTETGNIKVTAYLNNNIIKYFVATFPNGIIATFGFETNNIVGKIAYPITKKEDSKGNIISYTYTEKNNIYYPNEINYGLRKGTNIVNSGKIKFTYEARTDIDVTYIGGIELKQDQRLKEISTYFNNQLLRTYILSYEYKTVSLLKKVDCISSGKYLNPLFFYYGENSTITKLEKYAVKLENYYTNFSASNFIFSKWKFDATLNQDGLISYPEHEIYGILTTKKNSAGEIIGTQYGSTYPSNLEIPVYGKLSSSNSPASKIISENGFIKLIPLDVDGDGNEELVKINSNIINSTTERLTFKVYNAQVSSGTINPNLKYTFTIDLGGVTESGGLYSGAKREYLTGDFLGNGKQSVLLVSYTRSSKDWRVKSYATLIDIDAKIKPQIYDKECFILNEEDAIFTLDFNGDGKTDICHMGYEGTTISSFNDSGSLYQLTNFKHYFIDGNEYSQSSLLMGDINGDGKTDFLVSPIKSYQVKASFRNCGSCDVCMSANTTDDFICPYAEFLPKRFIDTGNQWNLYLSNGGSEFIKKTIYLSKNSVDTKFILQDVNLDQKVDLVVLEKGILSVYLADNGTIKENPEPQTIEINKDSYLISGNITQNNKESQLFAIYNNELTPITFTRNDSKQRLLTGTINSLGVITKHTYGSLKNPSGIYSKGTPGSYPYANMVGSIYLYAGYDKYFNNTLIAGKSISYIRGLTHTLGMGFLGFEKIIIKDDIKNLSETETFDPLNFGVLKSVDSPLLSATYNYTTVVASNKIAKVTLANKTEKDKLKDISVTSTYTYDTYGNPTKEVIDYGGGLKTTTDKKYNNLTGTPYILGQVSEESVTNERSGTSASVKAVLVYNTKGQVTTKKNYYGANQTAEESFTYDANNNLTEAKSKSYTSANWLVKKYSYDTYGRITTETDPLGFTTTYGYDTKGQVNSVKNHKAHETKYEYDIWGRKTKTTYADGSVETSSMAWASSPAGALILSTTTATGQPATQLYVDALGREVRKGVMRFDGKYLYTDNVYDSKGRVQKTSLPFKGAAATQWNTPAYDSYDRIVSLTYASGKKDSYAYDKNKVTATIDNVAKTTTYDATGKVISVTDPAGTITYNLRADGQPSSIVAPGSITTSFEYDTYGRQTKLIDPSAGTSLTAYDAAGNVNKETDANNQVTDYIFDRLGRIKEKTVAGIKTTFLYNHPDSLLTSVSSNNGISKTFVYDNLMRLSIEKETVTDGKWLQKTYSYTTGNTSSIAYVANTGNIVTENYVYTNGNMSEIKLNNTTSIWKLTQENDLGMATGATTGALTRTYGYDVFGLPTARVIKNGATTIQNFSYNFTATTGNLNWRKDNNRNIQENFTYDNLNRLTGFGGKTITYDVKGNITDFTTVGKFSYTNTSKPYAVTEISPYGTEIPLRNQTITYNGMMRPSSITEDIYRADFIYNTDADRVRMQIKKNNVVDLTRYYIGGQYEFETGVAGTKEKLYLGGDAYSAAAVYVKEGTGAWQIYYIGRDYLGSITHVINASGAVKQELSYDAWGRLRNPVNQQLYAIGSEPALFLARGYTGHEHLPMFGLINMNARLYDPVIGRFLSPDPYVQSPDDSQNFNRFSYALNNPLRYMDPTGEVVWTTSDPQVIESFFRDYNAGGGVDFDTYHFSGWERGEGGNISIDDELGKLYISYGRVEDGVVTVIGESFDLKRETNWYGQLSELSLSLGMLGDAALFKGGTYVLYRDNIGYFGKYYASTSVFTGSAKIGRIPLSLTNTAKVLGPISAGITIGTSIAAISNYSDNPNSPNAVHPVKGGLDIGMAFYTLAVPGIGTGYFVVDATIGWKPVIEASMDVHRFHNEMNSKYWWSPTWSAVTQY